MNRIIRGSAKLAVVSAGPVTPPGAMSVGDDFTRKTTAV